MQKLQGWLQPFGDFHVGEMPGREAEARRGVVRDVAGAEVDLDQRSAAGCVLRDACCVPGATTVFVWPNFSVPARLGSLPVTRLAACFEPFQAGLQRLRLAC